MKCNEEVKERENHNITPLLRLKSQTSSTMIIFKVEAHSVIGKVFRYIGIVYLLSTKWLGEKFFDLVAFTGG